MPQRITHVRKPDRDDRYDAIQAYGQRQYDGTETVCEIHSNGHTKYLQTRVDSSRANNLLNLPPC